MFDNLLSLVNIILGIIYFIVLYRMIKKFGFKDMYSDKLTFSILVFITIFMIFILKEVICGYRFW